MIKIGASTKIEEISKKEKTTSKKGKQTNESTQNISNTLRPEVVDAKVYKLKSAFVKNSVFITSVMSGKKQMFVQLKYL